jgi:hypothetical protein
MVVKLIPVLDIWNSGQENNESPKKGPSWEFSEEWGS